MIYKKLLPVLAAMVLLSACATPAPPAAPASSELSSQEEVSSSPENLTQETPTPSPPALPSQKPAIYLFDAERDLYEKIPFSQPPETVAELVQGAASAAGSPVRLRGVSQQKGMVVVDFEPDSPPVVGMGSSYEASMLDSIAMTILQNHLTAESICYRVGGDAYESGHLLFGIDEPYNPTPLLLVEADEQVYAAIRAQFPYDGLHLPFEGVSLPAPFVDDAISRELASFLWSVGAPIADAVSPAALDPDFMLEQAIIASPLLSYTPSAGVNDRRPVAEIGWQIIHLGSELEPIAAAVGDTQIVLKEHVEAAAHEMFGDEITLTHRSVFKWVWHETEGVYTPPHMGGGTKLPILFSYEKTGDRYRVECAFIAAGLGGYFDDAGNPIDEADMNNSLQTRCQRREFVVERRTDGSFQLISHRLLPTE